jgi:cytochrome d ubiquinol oxidase subunit II
MHAAALVIPLAAIASLFAIPVFARRRQELAAFLSSSIFLAAMLAGAAAALYPDLLPASGDRARSLTIFNAAAGRHALSAGLVWWSGGILLAIGYFVFVYRMARGKIG